MASLSTLSPTGDGAVDLVGGDLEEAEGPAVGGGRGAAALMLGARCLEERVHAHDPGVQEGGGLEDGPVDVGFGGEVDDGVVLAGELPHERLIGDVGLDEAVALAGGGVIGQTVEVRRVAGVGELVHDRDDVRRGGEAPMHEGRADEAGAAGDDDAHGRRV